MKTCKRVKLTGAKFHDFRRTAVRNLVRAGTPEKVCMAVSGHKTRSGFERYNIVSADDVKAAVSALESYLSNSAAQFRHKRVVLNLSRISQSVLTELMRKGGLEPPRREPLDPKSSASANSATFARNRTSGT